MIRCSKAVGLTGALSALVLCTTTGTAAASSPARGSATSQLNLLTVQAGGHRVSIGNVAMVSSTLASTPEASIGITPLTVDGTSYGAQTVTPSSSPVTVAAQSTPSALSAIAALASPSIAATATRKPSTSAGTTSLGTLKLLGMNVPLNGAVDLGSSVSSSSGALAQKTVLLEGLALPSIADVLAALGLNLDALPVGTVSDLVDGLDLVNGAVDTAQAALTAAAAQVDATTAQLTSANATLASATTALTNALKSVNTTTYPAAATLTGYLGMVDKSGVNTTPGLSTAYTDYTTASGAVAQLNTALNAAQALVTSTTATLRTALDAVLDGTPLVSIDTLRVVSKAAATSAKPGGQVAQITGGEIDGLKVLGTDVLDTVTGSSSLDLLGLTGSVTSQVDAALATVTGTLSSVLSTVPGLSGLKVPQPTVKLLGKTTSTSVANGFGQATASLSGLRITIPGITVPTAALVPNAAQLPALTGVTQVAGALTSAPVQLDLVTLSEQSAFAPAVTTVGTPETPTNLPKTGLPVGLGVAALLSVAGAVFLRRRTAE